MLQLQTLKDFLKYNSLLLIFMIVIFIIVLNIIEVSNRNKAFKQQEVEKRLEIETLQLQTQKQVINNEFLKTDYYLDIAIREQKALVLEGETVLIIKPQKVDEIKEDYQPPIELEKDNLQDLSYADQWLHFLFGNDDI